MRCSCQLFPSISCILMVIRIPFPLEPWWDIVGTMNCQFDEAQILSVHFWWSPDGFRLTSVCFVVLFFFFFFHSRWASGTLTPLAKFGYFWHIFFIPDGWVAYPVLFKILCVHICDINSHMRFLNWKQAYYGKLIYLGWISETQMAIAPNIFSKSKPILKFWY